MIKLKSLLNEKHDLETYHKSYTSAINAAKEYAEKKGYMNEATMHPMTREGALDNLREVILNIKPYSREVVKHCEAAIKIIEKFEAK
jgi:hypothetical protein